MLFCLADHLILHIANWCVKLMEPQLLKLILSEPKWINPFKKCLTRTLYGNGNSNGNEKPLICLVPYNAFPLVIYVITILSLCYTALVEVVHL